MLQIAAHIGIPDDELKFSFSRSSGPGGQNVNKVSSKATMRWAATASASVPVDVRDRFLKKYASQLTKDGELVVYSQEFRDQPKNIDACREKLRAMLASVVTPPKKRRPTKPTKGSKTRRLTDKKSRAKIKEGRRFRGE
ncbi:MAG: aminoacyl-tRNA hydrolase [Planctomycetaceae bacterium]|nr:aminoacyl-tRNA hydrolase [Planctomycetaceae bacterium]